MARLPSAEPRGERRLPNAYYRAICTGTMGLLETILGFSVEIVLIVALALFGLLSIKLFAKLVRGEYAPENLVASYREGKDVEE